MKSAGDGGHRRDGRRWSGDGGNADADLTECNSDMMAALCLIVQRNRAMLYTPGLYVHRTRTI